MPNHKIEKRGDKFVVLDEDGEKVLGTHPTMEAARKQLAVIESKKKGLSGDRMDIEGVEIFRTGKWKGDPYSEADLDSMVDAFNRAGLEPPVRLSEKAGVDAHEDGGPAWGWVNGLRRVGDRLVADLRDIPQAVYRWIKDRRYDHISSGIVWDADVDGVTFPRLLDHISLLGGDMPAVSGLAPLRAVVNSLKGRKTAVCTLDRSDFGGSDPMADKDKATKALEAKLDQATKDLTAAQEQIKTLTAKAEEGNPDTEAQLKKMQADNKKATEQIAKLHEDRRQDRIETFKASITIPYLRDPLGAFFDLSTKQGDEKVVTFTNGDKDPEKVSYTVAAEKLRDFWNQPGKALMETFSVTKNARDDDAPPEDEGEAGERIVKLVAEKMAKDKDLKEDAAMDLVLAENPDLAKQYAGQS